MTFQCNICCEAVRSLSLEELDRETGFCPSCRSTGRLRALALLVGISLYGIRSPVLKWPKSAKRGIGVSDWPPFTHFFGGKFQYTNTQFDGDHTSDRDVYSGRVFLDVTNPPAAFLSCADVVTCSDVLEHVAPPIQSAFDGLHSLLKPGGTLVLTVPYTLDQTVEHFPDLYEWKVKGRGERRSLLNMTRTGERQRFENLRFHSGGDSVLEMRVFGIDDLRAHLEKAGFANISVMSEDVLDFGIRFPDKWSRPITATALE